MQLPKVNSPNNPQVPKWIVAPDLDSPMDDGGPCPTNIAPCPPGQAIISPIQFAKDDAMRGSDIHSAVPGWIVPPDLESPMDDGGPCPTNIAPCPPITTVTSPIQFAKPKDDVTQSPDVNSAVLNWIVAPDLESPMDDGGPCPTNIAPCTPPYMIISPIQFAKDDVMRGSDSNSAVPGWIVPPDLESPMDDGGPCPTNIAPCPPPIYVQSPIQFANRIAPSDSNPAPTID